MVRSHTSCAPKEVSMPRLKVTAIESNSLNLLLADARFSRMANLVDTESVTAQANQSANLTFDLSRIKTEAISQCHSSRDTPLIYVLFSH